MDPYLDPLDGPPPGPDPLRSIVEKASAHRRRAVVTTASAAAVVALAAGGGIGYALSNHGGHSSTVAAGPASAGASALATAHSANSPGVISEPVEPAAPLSLRHLFNRTVGPVTVRGFAVMIPSAACSSVAPVPSLSEMVAEVSTPGMVATARDASTGASSAVLQVVGSAEGDPVALLLVSVPAGDGTVAATFSTTSARDSMAPVGGWAVLATELPAGSATSALTATVTASGAHPLSMVVRAGLPSSGWFGYAPPVALNCCPPGPMPLPPTSAAQVPAKGAPVPGGYACASSGSGVTGNSVTGSGSSGPPVTAVAPATTVVVPPSPGPKTTMVTRPPSVSPPASGASSPAGG